MVFFPPPQLQCGETKIILRKSKKATLTQVEVAKFLPKLSDFPIIFSDPPKFTNKSFREGQISHPMKNT